MSLRYATVSLDADSTLSDVEGIDWLAARREPIVAANVAALTKAAMNGEVTLDSIYGKRLEIVAPSRGDIFALSETYVQRVAPGAVDVIRDFIANGVRVLILSGGVRAALLPLAELLGVRDEDVHAVEIRLGATGSYLGFDATARLAKQEGKLELLKVLSERLPRPILHVGDGMTDAVTRDVADAFAVYTGFVRRAAVIPYANFEVTSFGELRSLVLGGGMNGGQ
jgi:HAD superfamily phosphoserine phosphatase-like hydrolase